MQGRDLAHVIFEKQNHDIRRHSNRRTFSRNRQCMMVWFLTCDCVNDLILYFVPLGIVVTWALWSHICAQEVFEGGQCIAIGNGAMAGSCAFRSGQHHCDSSILCRSEAGCLCFDARGRSEASCLCFDVRTNDTEACSTLWKRAPASRPSIARPHRACDRIRRGSSLQT